MGGRRDRVLRKIKSFVENPVTCLVEGFLLSLIGISDATRTFQDDITHFHVRVGHGLILIGFFSILRALPYLIEGLEAGSRSLEAREQRAQASEGVDRP
jgi:hypothetical protein